MRKWIWKRRVRWMAGEHVRRRQKQATGSQSYTTQVQQTKKRGGGAHKKGVGVKKEKVT